MIAIEYRPELVVEPISIRSERRWEQHRTTGVRAELLAGACGTAKWIGNRKRYFGSSLLQLAPYIRLVIVVETMFRLPQIRAVRIGIMRLKQDTVLKA